MNISMFYRKIKSIKITILKSSQRTTIYIYIINFTINNTTFGKYVTIKL